MQQSQTKTVVVVVVSGVFSVWFIGYLTTLLGAAIVFAVKLRNDPELRAAFLAALKSAKLMKNLTQQLQRGDDSDLYDVPPASSYMSDEPPRLSIGYDKGAAPKFCFEPYRETWLGRGVRRYLKKNKNSPSPPSSSPFSSRSGDGCGIVSIYMHGGASCFRRMVVDYIDPALGKRVQHDTWERKDNPSKYDARVILPVGARDICFWFDVVGGSRVYACERQQRKQPWSPTARGSSAPAELFRLEDPADDNVEIHACIQGTSAHSYCGAIMDAHAMHHFPSLVDPAAHWEVEHTVLAGGGNSTKAIAPTTYLVAEAWKGHQHLPVERRFIFVLQNVYAPHLEKLVNELNSNKKQTKRFQNVCRAMDCVQTTLASTAAVFVIFPPAAAAVLTLGAASFLTGQLVKVYRFLQEGGLKNHLWITIQLLEEIEAGWQQVCALSARAAAVGRVVDERAVVDEQWWSHVGVFTNTPLKRIEDHSPF